MQARLSNYGQVCTAAKRFILHEKIADRFISQFSAELSAVTLGDPLDEKTTLGPFSSSDARDRLMKR